MEYTFISGEVCRRVPEKYGEHDYVIQIQYLQGKAIIKVPVRLKGTIANQYFAFLKNVTDQDIIHIDLIGNIFFAKGLRGIYIQAIHVNLNLATSVYKEVIKTIKTKIPRRDRK